MTGGAGRNPGAPVRCVLESAAWMREFHSLLKELLLAFTHVRAISSAIVEPKASE